MSFTAKIQADVSDFNKGINEAISKSQEARDKIKKEFDKVSTTFLKVGGAISAMTIGVGAALTKLSVSAGDTAATFNNLSNATAMTTDFLQEMKFVAESQNSSFEGFQRTIESFQRRLKGVTDDGDRTVDVLKSMGVEVSDLSGKMRSSENVYMDTLKALANMENGLEKTALGTKLFGQNWNEAALLISDGADNIDELREKAHELGVVLGKDLLDSADDFATNMGLIKSQFDTIKTKIGAEFAPLLSETLIPLFNEKILPAFNKLADFIGKATERFNALSPETKNLIITLGGVTMGLGATLLALGALLKILPAIGSAVTLMTGPFGIAIAAIAGAAILIIKNWDEIRAYFTTGAGAKMFQSIQKLIETVKNKIVSDFNKLKTIVLDIWDKFGGNLTRMFNNVFGIVIDIVTTAINLITDTINVFSAVLSGDFSGALTAFKTLFLNVFDGLANIVRRQFANILEGLGMLLKALKLEKWAESVENFAVKIAPAAKQIETSSDGIVRAAKKQRKAVKEVTETIKVAGDALDVFKDGSDIFELVKRTANELEQVNKRLLDLRTGALAVENVKSEIEKTEEKAKELATALETLTGGRDSRFYIRDETEIPKIEPISAAIVPELDTSKLESAIESLGETLEPFVIDLGDIVGSTISDLFEGIGTAIADGGNVLENIGSVLLGTIGRLAQNLGKQLIAFGTAGLALQKLLVNPLTAIAAGAALVALGAAASSAASKTMSSIGGGGGYGSAASLATVSTSPVGESFYKGAYKEDFNVEFKIGTNELVGVLDTASQRKNRL